MSNELDDSYAGLPGFAKFRGVAVNFPFGRTLPSATFPSDFVKTYEDFSVHEPVDWDADATYFIAEFQHGLLLCMYDGLFSPQMICSQNSIIAESQYAEPGATIMPPGYYAIGSAYDDVSELRIMICLAQEHVNYGKIYVWRLAWDALGTQDNTGGLGLVGNSLQEMMAGLQTRSKIEEKILKFKLNGSVD
jgi:hypothetical protein